MEEMLEKVRAKGSSDNVDVRKRKASGCADYSLQHHSSHRLETEVEDSCGMVFKSNPKVDKNVEHPEKILDLDNQSFAHTLAYEEVIKMFLKGIQSAGCADIVNISRCSGSIFKARMELFQKQLEITKKYRGDANVRYAWLPSSKKALSSVMACGLGLSKFESFHGIGIPLAAADFSGTSAKICDDDEDGVRHMILCRVIMGKMELINPGSNQFHPSNETFDGGVDNLDNPHQYTVWRTNVNTHICPVFLVSFKIPLEQEGTIIKRVKVGQHHSSHHLETEVEDSCGMVFKSNPKVDKNVEHLEKILDLDNQSFAHTLAYEEVIKMFLKGIQSAGCADIVNISRCSGSIFKARMELFQKQLEITKKYRGDANVRYAWLPSSKKALSSVMACGLGLSKFESFHGIGIPLAAADFSGTSAKICAVDEDGVRHMILCRVIMGKMELINPGSNHLHPSNETFDSGVDDLDNPHQYTVRSMNINTHICPEFVLSFKISLAQEGTTIGFLKFDEGFAAFSDSRKTTRHDDLLKWTYDDNRKKCHPVSRTSNLMYLSSGFVPGTGYFISKLDEEITKLEEDGNIVGIEEAVRVAHTILKGRLRVLLKEKGRKIGGILFGQGPNQEYNAYLLECKGDDVPEPVPLGDRPFFAYGGGAHRAVENLEVLEMEPLPTLETCLANLANMALFLYLKVFINGGPFNVFFLKKGHNLKEVPDHVIDPVTNHKNRYTLYDGQVLLLIVPREHGEGSSIEINVPCHWDGAECSSRLTDIPKYRVYRAFFKDSKKADAILKNLSPVPEKESRDSHIPSYFGHYIVDWHEESVTMYVSMCSEESLQFVEDNRLQWHLTEKSSAKPRSS